MRLALTLLMLLALTVLRAQERVFVFLNSKPDKAMISEEQTAALMKEHLANIEKMAREGKLLVAGPFDGGGGIFVFNTGDVNQTNEWLQTDPAIRAKRWNIEVFKVAFDKGGACLVGEPYEMVTYNFARVNFINDIANYKMNNTVINGWDQVVKRDSVLAVGRFPQDDGGFVVFRGEEEFVRESFSNDQVGIELRKLWVARGAFCE